MDPLLYIQDINKKFDGTIALENFSLEIPANTITGIIGPNGAGKTTLFNVITGFLVPESGSIHYQNQQLVGMPPYQIARKGIVRTFQQLRLITRLTCPGQYNAGFPESGWRTAAEYLYLFQTDQNPGTGKSKRGARDSQLVGHSGKRKRAG